MHQNKQTTHEKKNLSKTEQSVVICRFGILLEPPKFQNELLEVSNLSINHLKNLLTKYHSPVKNGSNSRER